MTIFMERLQKLMDERNLTDKDLREQCGDISKTTLQIGGKEQIPKGLLCISWQISSACPAIIY